MAKMLTQTAPWPDELEDLVAHYRYRPGWRFHLHENYVRDRADANDFTSEPIGFGTTLDIITWGYNSYHRPTRGEWKGYGDDDDVCADCGEPWPCSSYVQSPSNPTYRPPYQVHHFMPVPPATFNRQSWEWWLLEMCVLVERHEACEFASFVYERDNHVGIEKLGTYTEVRRPFRPVHAPGWNPYMLVVVEDSDVAQRTSFRGAVKPR